ncbi:MAG: DNRLRE domain-containing protein [Armatimonadota bacterium]|nr:DNRLRE domain-containing protein [bacterium]
MSVFRTAVIAALVLLTTIGTAYSADVISLPSADTWIDSDSSGTRYGAASTLLMGRDQSNALAMFQFDFTQPIFAGFSGSAVSSAKLYFFNDGQRRIPDANITITPFACRYAWNESTVSYDWVYMIGGNSISGFVDSSTAGQGTVHLADIAAVPFKSVVSIDITAIVQKWADGSLVNNGLMLMPEGGFGSQFAWTKEATGSDEVYRPYIEVNYSTAPEPGAGIALLTGLVGLVGVVRRRAK